MKQKMYRSESCLSHQALYNNSLLTWASNIYKTCALGGSISSGPLNTVLPCWDSLKLFSVLPSPHMVGEGVAEGASSSHGFHELFRTLYRATCHHSLLFTMDVAGS
jgi:hypothetical protein